MKGPHYPSSSQHVPHVLAGKGGIIGQLKEPSKLHPPLDALNGVGVEVSKGFSLKSGGEDRRVTIQA